MLDGRIAAWYGHELQTIDNNWVKKCTEYEVEGPRQRGRAQDLD